MKSQKDIRFRKADVSAALRVEIDGEALYLFSLIDERKPLRDILAEAGMAAGVFKKCLATLYSLDLIERVEVEPCLDEAFLASMTRILVDLLGPLGEILPGEAAAQLSLQPEGIPLSRTEEYVRAVIAEIPGEREKAAFRKSLTALKKTGK